MTSQTDVVNMGFAYDEIGLPVIDAPHGPNGHSLSASREQAPASAPAGFSQEDEIGELLLQVQRFVDETAHEAERNARSIIEGAKTEANRIVEQSRQEAEQTGHAIIKAATFEANRVMENSRNIAPQRPIPTTQSVDPQVVSNLTNAIAEFAGTNRLLFDELVQLRNALAAAPLSPS
jgi:vacuolar-type H+-ATPase subunit H